MCLDFKPYLFSCRILLTEHVTLCTVERYTARKEEVFCKLYFADKAHMSMLLALMTLNGWTANFTFNSIFLHCRCTSVRGLQTNIPKMDLDVKPFSEQF